MIQVRQAYVHKPYLQCRVIALFVAGASRVFLICFGVHYWRRLLFAERNWLNSHIHIYENSGISTTGGVHLRPVKNNEDGTMDIDQIESAIRNPDFEICYPKTRLICLKNSHANIGGRVLSVEYTDQVGELAKIHNLKLHIDGARIFNASVALGVPVHRIVQAADSVSVCLTHLDYKGRTFYANIYELETRCTAMGDGAVDNNGGVAVDQLITPWNFSISSGHNLLRDPHHNKGLAFTERERDADYLHGLLIPTVATQELQV